MGFWVLVPGLLMGGGTPGAADPVEAPAAAFGFRLAATDRPEFRAAATDRPEFRAPVSS